MAVVAEYRKGEAPIKPEYLIKEDLPASESVAVDKKATWTQRSKQPRIPKSRKLCPQLSRATVCPFADTCQFSHDIARFVATKPADLGPRCHLFDTYGHCKYGLACRFAMAHTNPQDFSQTTIEKDTPKYASNEVSMDLLVRLRKRQEKFPLAEAFNPEDSLPANSTKRVDFRGKTYLAPLTTVGNLPFRRICKGFGVDITCSEMTIASNLLQGQKSEWALVRRHHSEDLFGIQLAGSRPDVIGRATELLSRHCQMDFIDLNMGCPVDSAYNKGGGSALLNSPAKIERIVRTMCYVNQSCDTTVKFRTGVLKNNNTVHDLVPKFQQWGVAMGTLHGRSRQQRYTKLADWDYIGQCHQLSDHMPLFGGGDVMSWEEYWDHMETQHQADGIMIGRGALMKPWVFKEIRERRVWDISATERLDIMKEFARFGMEHWGTDDQGLSNVRRYLLEWQSFLYRYIPAGILEVLPQRVNDRPPRFVGRNDLETLMASSQVKDWIKLSEMILGPAPPDFTFTAKHKSNAY